MTLMAIECPEGVEPGQALIVGGPDGQDVEVIVPEGVGPGDTFEVDVGGGGEEEEEAAEGQEDWTPRSGVMDITVPDGVEPGQALLVTAPDGEDVEVIVPEGLGPGDTFQVAVDELATPQPQATEDDEDWGEEEEAAAAPADEPAAVAEEHEGQDGQVMDITVPDGVEPGQALLVTGPDGSDVEVVVPDGLGPGDSFQVTLGAGAEEADAEPPEEVKKEFKLIMLGAAGAGKSCLVSRLLNVDDEISETHTPTLGMEHEKHVLTTPSNKLLKLQVWDRAGVATYGAIEKAYWKKAAAAMLVYDAADRESFDYVTTAAEEITKQARSGMPVLLVANKVDLSEQAAEAQEVDALCGSLADSLGLSSVPFMEASASDAFNVEESFAALADLAYHSEFSPTPEQQPEEAQEDAELGADAEAEEAERVAAEEEAEAARQAEAEEAEQVAAEEEAEAEAARQAEAEKAEATRIATEAAEAQAAAAATAEAEAAAAAEFEAAEQQASSENAQEKSKGKKEGSRFGIKSPKVKSPKVKSPFGRSSTKGEPAAVEAPPPEEPADQGTEQRAADVEPEEAAPEQAAADEVEETPAEPEPELPAHAALVVALTADTAEPVAQAELEKLCAMAAGGQEPPVEVSLLIELSATLAERLEAGVTPQVQLKALQLFGALSARGDPRLGPLFLRDLSGFVAASAAFEMEPDAEHGDKPKLMVRKSARKCLGELAVAHPSKLEDSAVKLLNEMTANNDQTVQTAGIDTLTAAVNAGGNVAASQLSLLLTGRLADEATSVKLKALRLLMVLESKCGADLIGYVTRDAVKLLGATTVWQCPPDPKHGEKPMIMVQKAARKCLDQHTKRAAKITRKPPMIKWNTGSADSSSPPRKKAPAAQGEAKRQQKQPDQPEEQEEQEELESRKRRTLFRKSDCDAPEAGEQTLETPRDTTEPSSGPKPKVPSRRPPATKSTQSPAGIAAGETPRERREAKAKARRQDHEAKKVARQEMSESTGKASGRAPRRPPPTPPSAGETEFARKQEERARRRANAEKAQKKKAEQQKASAALEARKRAAGAEERKRRREEAASERKAELRRGGRKSAGPGGKGDGAPASQIPTRRPPSGHAGGLSTFLTRQADFDEERKMKLQAKKDEVMAQENVHLKARPTVNPPRVSGGGASRGREPEDFLERQRKKHEERALRLEEKRRELRRQQVAGTPRLNESSLEIARHMAGPGGGRTSSMERLTRDHSPRALEKMEQKKKEIAKKQVVEPFKMGDRSRDIIVQKYGNGTQASTATMQRLTQPTKSYGKKKLRQGDKKEVVVYRGWSRHVEYVPVDEGGRVSISPRLQNTRFYSGTRPQPQHTHYL